MRSFYTPFEWNQWKTETTYANSHWIQVGDTYYKTSSFSKMEIKEKEAVLYSNDPLIGEVTIPYPHASNKDEVKKELFELMGF